MGWICPMCSKSNSLSSHRCRGCGYERKKPLEKESPQTLSELVKSERLRQGLTQQKLAEKAGVGVTAISYIETDSHSPSVVTAGLILKALGVEWRLGARKFS